MRTRRNIKVLSLTPNGSFLLAGAYCTGMRHMLQTLATNQDGFDSRTLSCPLDVIVGELVLPDIHLVSGIA